VHIFNFNKNIYKEYLELQFLKKIREEKKFISAQSLAAQVQKDIKLAKTLLSPH
jgi:riboflavin kinase/FMN adenylyltransferase